MRREIEAIRKALISGKREVSANQTWKRICQITEAGDIEGKKYDSHRPTWSGCVPL